MQNNKNFWCRMLCTNALNTLTFFINSVFSHTWWAFRTPTFALPFQQNQPQLITSHSSLITQIPTPCCGFCIFIWCFFFHQSQSRLLVCDFHVYLSGSLHALCFCAFRKTCIFAFSHFFCLRLAKHRQKLAKNCFLIYTVHL